MTSFPKKQHLSKYGAVFLLRYSRTHLLMQETWVPSQDQEDPLEKEIATCSSILAWRTHGQRSLVGYSPWSHKESDMTEHAHNATTHISKRRQLGWAPQVFQKNTFLLGIYLQPGLGGGILSNSGMSICLSPPNADFWKQIYHSSLSQEKSIPVLEIQSSLGKPSSTKSKLHQKFITHKSFLQIGSHPAATLLPVFSHFCSSIKKFNPYSLSEQWTSR